MNARRAIIAIVACAPVGCAESPPVATEVPLAGPVWTMEVTGEPHVAELADGTVAITMPGERSLALVDSLGTVLDSVGRSGEGPGEFRQLGNVFSLEDGRFAVVDPVLRRVTRVRRGESATDIVSIPAGHEAGSMRIAASGAWISERRVERRGDSVEIVASRPPHTQISTIASFHVPATQFIPLGELAINAAPEYAARDAWGMAEGGIWIARGVDNRTETVTLEGHRSPSEPVPFARIGTVPADRDRWRGLPAPERFRAATRPLAAVKGPFQEVVGSEDGMLWFWLNQPAGHEREVYAIRRIGGGEAFRLVLPNAHKIVAVGPRHIFVYGMVDDGAFLTAHPRPSTGTARSDGK